MEEESAAENPEEVKSSTKASGVPKLPKHFFCCISEVSPEGEDGGESDIEVEELKVGRPGARKPVKKGKARRTKNGCVGEEDEDVIGDDSEGGDLTSKVKSLAFKRFRAAGAMMLAKAEGELKAGPVKKGKARRTEDTCKREDEDEDVDAIGDDSEDGDLTSKLKSLAFKRFRAAGAMMMAKAQSKLETRLAAAVNLPGEVPQSSDE